MMLESQRAFPVLRCLAGENQGLRNSVRRHRPSDDIVTSMVAQQLGTGDTPKFHKAMCVAVLKMRHRFCHIFSAIIFFFGVPPFSDEPTWFMGLYVLRIAKGLPEAVIAEQCS